MGAFATLGQVLPLAVVGEQVWVVEADYTSQSEQGLTDWKYSG